MDLRPRSLFNRKFWGKRGPTGETEGAGDPTGHICSHAGNPRPQSLLSPRTLDVVTAPPGETRGCKYTAAQRGSRAGAEVPGAVTRQDDRAPSSMPRSHAASWKGVDSRSAEPPGDSGPQTSDLTEDLRLNRREATIRSSRFQSVPRPHLHGQGQHTHHF